MHIALGGPGAIISPLRLFVFIKTAQTSIIIPIFFTDKNSQIAGLRFVFHENKKKPEIPVKTGGRPSLFLASMSEQEIYVA